MDHILSIVLFTPLAGLLVLLAIPSSNPRAIKLWANIAAFLGFLVSLPLVFQFDRTKDFQFVEQAPWIPSIGATYHIGIDGLGLLLVMLTTLVGFIAILSSWNAIRTGSRNTTPSSCCCRPPCWASSCRSISCCFSFSGKPCWCRCTSSSPSGAASAGSMRP